MCCKKAELIDNYFTEYFLILEVIVYWTIKKRSKYLVVGPGARKKKPSGYRVAHDGYLLTSCPGLNSLVTKK